MTFPDQRYPDERPAPGPASTLALSLMALLAVVCAAILLSSPLESPSPQVAASSAGTRAFAVTGEVDPSAPGRAPAATSPAR